MKKILSVLVVVLVAVANTYGQTFALASQSKAQGSTSYSAINFAGYREHGRLGTATITGGIIASAGFVTTVIGLVVYIGEALNGYNNQNYQPPANQYATGTALLQVGGGLAIAGGIVGIVGAIHDHSQRSGRWGVVAPKPNQAGLAYNF